MKKHEHGLVYVKEHETLILKLKLLYANQNKRQIWPLLTNVLSSFYMNFYVKVSLNSCYNLWSSDFTDCLSTSHWPIIFILHAIFNPEQWHLSEFLITFDLFLPAHVCQFLESMELVGFFVTHYYTSLKLSLYHVSGFFFNVTYYYTSSKLTMYHYKWLRIMYFKHIKHVSSWRKHNVLFYSYAIILPRNLSLQKIT